MSKYSENMPPSLQGAIEWMYDQIKPNSTLLDFGCSTGYFGAYLKAQKGCTVYGVEISADIEEARKVLDGVYSFDLDGEWPKEVYEHSYDYLFFGDVIEHLKYPQRTLEKATKLLKKQGKIFISTPNIAHISTRLELMNGNFEYESMGILDETHLKYFTKRSLEKLVCAAGYKIDLLDYSANDYPREVVERLLEKSGLKPSPKFWGMIKATEARAFQYKLMISRKRKSIKHKHKPLQTPQKPEQFRDDLISDLTAQIENIKTHADKQAEIITHLESEIKQLKHPEASIEKRISKGVKKILHKK